MEHVMTIMRLGAHQQVIDAHAARIPWATIATSVSGAATVAVS
jgi:hypothetical protein